MDIAAFYHCWAPGAWRNPLQEFLRALDESAFDGPLTLSVVGSDREVARVQREVARDHVLVRAETGFEQVTLDRVWQYAQTHDGAVLYAHTKGASTYLAHPDHPGKTADPWRSVMTDVVVQGWRQNLRLLWKHDVVGWAWLDDRVGWLDPGFAGNFWMARCDYIRQLPPPLLIEGRGGAEVWLGRADPRVFEREQWDREAGPSVLASVWPLLLHRWRWMAAGMPEDYPAPTGFEWVWDGIRQAALTRIR